MIPVDQTLFGYPGGNCLNACLASILECSLDEIPEMDATTHDGSWWGIMQRALQDRGLTAIYYVPNGEYCGAPFAHIAPPGYHLVTGDSPRGTLDDKGNVIGHVCVAKDGVIVHDPHPSRAGLASAPRDWILIVPMAQERAA
jgi:hypothetical protein